MKKKHKKHRHPRPKQRRAGAAGHARRRPPASRLPAPGPSLSRDQQEGESFELLESLDNFAPLRNQLRHLAGGIGEWAGIPIPLEGQPLVIEPTYPAAAVLTPEKEEPDEELDGIQWRNSFWSKRLRTTVHVFEHNGKIAWYCGSRNRGLDQQLMTLGASHAWGIEQEGRAVRTLGTLVRHHTFKQYLLTGMFLETSERSGVTYLFRKLRPTVAMRPAPSGDRMRILCALCLHPIAYYSESWAGAMCPTDDVIAHLMLMRGDEAMFWRRANQHAAYRPEAGI